MNSTSSNDTAVDLVKHFAERASSYDRADSFSKDKLVMDATLEILHACQGDRVLDVGAGTCSVMSEVATLATPPLRLVALDISQAMLDQCKHQGIERHVGHAEQLPFSDSSFSLMLYRQVLHYVDSIEAALNECARVMLPGGAVVIGQITPFDAGDEEHWVTITKTRQPLRRHFPTFFQLRDQLDKSFQITNCFQLRWPESLAAWTNRYECSEEQADHLHRLYINAPERYKLLHNVRQTNTGDIQFDNCWSFLRGEVRRDS